MRQVFTPEEMRAANDAVDRRSEKIVERRGDLRLGGAEGDPLAGDGVTGREDLGGMLGWDAPDSDVFRRVLAHPKLVPYYHAMVGEGYRMDHLPLLIQQAPGADGFVFHGGKMNDDGTWCEVGEGGTRIAPRLQSRVPKKKKKKKISCSRVFTRIHTFSRPRENA